MQPESLQRVYLLKLLRDQGIHQHNMDIVCHATVLSKIRYALCVWGSHITADKKPPQCLAS